MWFLFKILLVRGRNTCLCKGELCFILLRGVLASPCCFRSFFWLLVHWSYDHFYIHCYYLWYICVCVCVCVCLLHLSLYVLFLLYFYTHVSLRTQSLFLFHTWCLDEFCLSVSKRRVVKVYHVENSLLAKFFKSL